jgi:hypothetical protein
MKIMNHAGAAIDLFWVSSSPRGGLVKQNGLPIRNGTDAAFNTYDSHSFVVKWANKQQNDEAEAQAEAQARFTHGKYPSTVLVLADGEHGLRVQFKDTFQVAFDSISEGTNECLERFPDVTAHKGEFLECVTQGMVRVCVCVSMLAFCFEPSRSFFDRAFADERAAQAEQQDHDAAVVQHEDREPTAELHVRGLKHGEFHARVHEHVRLGRQANPGRYAVRLRASEDHASGGLHHRR